MYLVTGGCGFIGSHIVQRLLEKGSKVRILDDLSTGKLENIEDFRDDVEFVRGDIRDPEITRRVTRGVEGIFHQAALVSVPLSVKDPALNHDINITGTFNILESAAGNGVEKVVMASSAAVYGNDPELPKREDMRPQPESPYGLAKFISENYGELYSRTRDMGVSSLRYFNVYGPRQDPSSMYSGVLSLFTSAFKDSEPRLKIYGDGMQTRDFVYVTDIVDANLIMMEKGSSGCYNAGTGESRTLLDVVGILEAITGKTAVLDFRDGREGDILHSAANIGRLSALGYAAEYDLESGLEKYMAYLRGWDK